MGILSFGICYSPLAVCTTKSNLAVTLEDEMEHYHTSGTVLSHHLRTLIQEASSTLIFFINKK